MQPPAGPVAVQQDSDPVVAAEVAAEVSDDASLGTYALCSASPADGAAPVAAVEGHEGATFAEEPRVERAAGPACPPDASGVFVETPGARPDVVEKEEEEGALRTGKATTATDEAIADAATFEEELAGKEDSAVAAPTTPEPPAAKRIDEDEAPVGDGVLLLGAPESCGRGLVESQASAEAVVALLGDEVAQSPSTGPQAPAEAATATRVQGTTEGTDTVAAGAGADIAGAMAAGDDCLASGPTPGGQVADSAPSSEDAVVVAEERSEDVFEASREDLPAGVEIPG